MEDKIMLPIMKTRNVLPTLVDEFFGKDVFPTLWDLTGSTTVPAVNILETKDEFKIIVKVTGIGILIIGAIGFIINMIWQIFIK